MRIAFVAGLVFAWSALAHAQDAGVPPASSSPARSTRAAGDPQAPQSPRSEGAPNDPPANPPAANESRADGATTADSAASDGASASATDDSAASDPNVSDAAVDPAADDPASEVAPPIEPIVASAAEPASPAAAPSVERGLDPCATETFGRPIGPLSIPELDGQLGMAYRACPRTEVAISGDTSIVAHSSDFYGNVRGSGRVRLSALLDPNVEAFLSWEAFRAQTVISSVSASYVGLGYFGWGATARVYSEQGRVYAITGRVVLPTSTGLDNASQPLALDLGITGAWQADRALRFHMWVVLLGSIGVSVTAPLEPAGGIRVGGGAEWIPSPWLALVLELAAGFGYLDALDTVAARAGARFAIDSVGIELGASLPILGVRALDDGAFPIAIQAAASYRID